MTVTSDSTPLSAISTATKTGSPTRMNPVAAIAPGMRPPPNNRPATKNTRTGRIIEPNAPSGSRKKILISSQVSFQSPRNMVCLFLASCFLMANRMAGELSGRDDRHPSPQPLSHPHQRIGHKDRLPAVADAAHEFPDHPPRLRVEPSGQLIQKHEDRKSTRLNSSHRCI